ncbi:MAG: acyltransferase [Alphaproteobacteria bacterium]
MNRETSVYLDLVRFIAAMIVMFSHLGDSKWTGGVGWQTVPFGVFAVTAFFVLSGYVIAFAAATKERDPGSFVLHRLARIYSVALPALALSLLLTLLADTVLPARSVHWGSDPASVYMSSALFLNQIWFFDVTPDNNGPYWSLGYEAWYYIIFGLSVFVRGSWRFWLTGAAMIIAGPRILLMLPVWLTGTLAYKFTRQCKVPKYVAFGAWITTTLAILALAYWQLCDALACDCWPQAAHSRPLNAFGQYLEDYLIGLLFALNFVALHFSAPLWKNIAAFFEKPVRWLAGASFTIYLMHYPIALFLIAASPWPVGTLLEQAFVTAGTIIAVFALAEVTERKKAAWRSALSRLFGKAVAY